MNEKSNRREFVKSGSAAASAGFLIMKPQTVRGSQANSALTVGLIGAGNRGTHVTGLFAKNEFARVAAICDIYDDMLQAASKKFSGAKLFKAMMVYKEVGYPYMMMPDHVPSHPDDPRGSQAFAFAYGYIRALIQAVDQVPRLS